MPARAAALLLIAVLFVSAPVSRGGAETPPAFADLCKELAGEDGNARRRAAQLLGESGDPGAVTPLATAYRAESGDAHGVRAACATALGRIRTPQAAAVLGDMLQDKDYWVRKRAAEALGEIPGPEAREAVAKGLKDDDPRVRAAALLSLGTLKGPASAFLAALEDPDPRVCAAALEGLARSGVPEAATALAAALENPDPTIRYRAASLGARRGDTGALEILRQGLRSPATAGHALREASLAGCVAAPILAACSTDPDCPQKEQAFSAIEKQTGCPEATSRLVDAATRAEFPVAQRVRAAAALFDRNGELTPSQLSRVTQLLSEADPDLLAVGLQIVLERGNPGLVAKVAPLVRHDNVVVRHFALANLAKFGGADQEGSLAYALADPNGANVRIALEGLARIGTRASVPAVRSLLEDRVMRRYAQTTLEAIEARP